MTELKGSLSGLGLPAVVQLIGDLHHSGNLALARNGSRGVLGFADGRLVAASYNDDVRGLKALAACTLELVDSEFLFVEGAPAGERTMDLGGRELQKLFGRFKDGEVSVESLEAPPVKVDARPPPEDCPFLGFVDDAPRHYSRPTALHRCYAAGTAALVTGHEQRELCLSGRYATCPRFRNVPTSSSDSTLPAAAPTALDTELPSPPEAAPRRIPIRVTATQMALSSVTSPTPEPPPAAQPGYEPTRSRPAPKNSGFSLRSRRGGWLAPIGAGLGLVILVGGLLLALAALTGGPGQQPSTSAAQPQPAASAAGAETGVSPAPTVAAFLPKPAGGASPAPETAPPIARSVPTAILGQASPAAAAAPALASGVPVPTPVGVAVPVPGQALADVRFASGRQQGWLDNPPYTTWSDGAHRLNALQPTRFVAVAAPVGGPVSDVVVSATFRKTGGPPGGGYGLVVRDRSPEPLNGVNQSLRAYVLEVGDRGEFGIWRRDGDHWVDLVPWTRSDSVHPGGSPNDLEARAVGDRLTFSVNGAELAVVQDGTLPTGGVGVFVGGDNNEVALDRFAAQVPE